MKKLFYTVVLVAVSSVAAMAQQTWFEFDVSKELGDKLEISLAPELRFDEDFKLDEYFFEPGVAYAFNDYFALGGSYRLGNNQNKKGEDRWYGRFAFDAKTAYKWNNLQAKLRLRYTNSDDFTENEKTNYFRAKFDLEYAIKKLDLEPYVAYELYRDLDAGEYSKARWESGLQYKINKHHRVGAYFRLNDYLHSDKASVKIIGLSYKLKL
ncbi:DUF2490 domain-containing protein [Maribellus sp. YY47]|uniref:DUF2490 domain-containing protein n=1 Tax=Maribellus sp. YY47 TaxID=2929486 RepID=UPI00200097D5|nr:DUF2490 domain-containing protein [Maribellus sp. YY47]MCK3685869.1 DUF2490 domain-containing protein [Maribellus sp. YY47]